MQKLGFLFIAMLVTMVVQAQHTATFIIKSTTEKTPLAGATVSFPSLNKSATADSLGSVVFQSLPEGTYTLQVSFVGFIEQQLSVTIPQKEPATVFLKEDEEAEEEVIVLATRTSRTIANTPTRVEVISGEELEEKGNMKPGDIRMLLNESTGIQTQQTSATSYNSSIRIQGLDGRYTQLLRDGYPLFGGFSGGLSIMQIAPLNLRQVEVIKGSSSTLYGGGAIAGLVNLVSKTPTNEREISFMANGTSAMGADLSGFYSQRFKNVGVTLFGSANYASPYDPAGIGFTAIPKYSRYTIQPRLFLWGKKTNANIGFSFITEDRVGGNIETVKHGGSGYFEQNNTDRFSAEAGFTHTLNEGQSIVFKSSFSQFNRVVSIPNYTFSGRQQSLFSEASYNLQKPKAVWIIGATVLTDNFKEDQLTPAPLRNYNYTTAGLFLQNTYTLFNEFTVETGLRADHVKEFGFALLPRISLLYKPSAKLAARLGGGAGYKTPTVFNEEAEKAHFQNILPLQNGAENERSLGANFDVNYKTAVGSVGVSINQLFFYTRLNNPLVLVPANGAYFEFTNANGYLDTKGLETNVKLTYNDFKLFIGYTLADVNTHFNGVKETFPLTAKHRLNNVLMYEKEERWKLGLEAYYTSRQTLADGTFGKQYWTMGFMAEKISKNFSLFVNFENFTDVRQTRFNSIYTGPANNPVFKDIYAPVDGFVVNGGFKIKL